MAVSAEERERLLAAFIERFFEDLGSGVEITLDRYLDAFPDAREVVAEKYFELRRAHGLAASTGGTELEGEAGASSAELNAPRLNVGRYRLDRLLGQGGQGQVWLAEDPTLGRPVALKILDTSGPGVEARLRRFQREASIVSRLSHPGICTVHEAGLADGTPYIAMQYVEGRPLTAWLAARRSGHSRTAIDSLITWEAPETEDAGDEASSKTHRTTGAQEEASITREELPALLKLGEQVARALHAAHEAGVIHRDIKPANVMIDREGQPIILDFGLARSEDSVEATLTHTGQVFGTPAYMAPEQIEGEHDRIDHRADLYALAVTLFEMMTLRRPFEGANREQLYASILSSPTPDPRDFNRFIPSELSVILQCALDKDPERRYPSALALAEDLRRLREREPILARRPSVAARTWLWARRNPAVAASLLLAFLFLVGGLITSLSFLGQARDSARVASNERETAQRRLDEVEQMSDATLARRLLDDEMDLWPQRPPKVAAMERWLQEARALAARRPDHERVRNALREAAGPITESGRKKDDEIRRRRFASLYRKAARLEREVKNQRALLRESEGISERVHRAYEETGKRLPDPSIPDRDTIDRQVDLIGQGLEILEDASDDLTHDPRLEERLTLGIDDAKSEWRHDVLVQLLFDIDDVVRKIPSVDGRLKMAQTLRRRTLEEAGPMWTACLADIARNPVYGASEALEKLGFASRLRKLRPQLGLVPLGIDDHSGFWEFWLPDSGPRPPFVESEKGRGSISFSDPRKIYDPGITLVLLPGGKFRMGANKGPGVNRLERPEHDVVLAPFFISKFELTQGQWRRIMGTNPSRYPCGVRVGDKAWSIVFEWRHPVTDVSRLDAQAYVDRMELEIPTEAQWEYAARGGTRGLWWFGKRAASIYETKAGNVMDDDARQRGGKARPQRERRTDGFATTAPVGCFKPNPFGLQDVIGNVREWVREPIGRYDGHIVEENGLHATVWANFVAHRGGGCTSTPVQSRVTARFASAPTSTDGDIGFRVSRALDR